MTLVRRSPVSRPTLATALLAVLALSACSSGDDATVAAASTSLAPSTGATPLTTSTSTTSTSTTSTTTTTVAPTTTAVPTVVHTNPPATAAPTTAAGGISVPTGWRSTLVSLINGERAKAGLNPVALCGTLDNAAQDFSTVLAEWQTMSHVGPDGSTLYTRVAAAGYSGYSSVGENVAAGQLDAASVMGSWMASSGHRANILYPAFTQVGAGRTDALIDGNTVPYWVLDLGVGGSC